MSEKTELKNNEEDSNRDEDIVASVKSANKWEAADLGETDRKSKFLRLMGAAKKEHHGKFVIGDQKPNEARPKLDEHRLTEDLEVQFVQGLEHQRIGGRRGHIGLGYHSNTLDGQSQPDSSKQQDSSAPDSHSSTDHPPTADKPDTHSRDSADSSHNKRTAETKAKENRETSEEKKDVAKNDQDESGPTAAKKYKMTFVKASS